MQFPCLTRKIFATERFLVELKTTANLQHPHMLPRFHSGERNNGCLGLRNQLRLRLRSSGGRR